MNHIMYESRCKCKESDETYKKAKKRKPHFLSEGKPLQYPESDEILTKTFQIKYQKNLSFTGKLLLNSFQNKYLYYAIDDILYTYKSNPIEQNDLLAILYSPILSLHNNFSINFLDIWIKEIYIDEVYKTNKFIGNNCSFKDKYTSITIKLFYKICPPLKKQKLLW